MLTVNGRVLLRRIRWHNPATGSLTVIDRYLDRAEESISVGTLEMAARLNCDSANFDRTAENLLHAAHIQVSGETLRKRIESEGRRVLQAQGEGKLPVMWSASDCRVDPKDANSPCRLYLGCDGVTVPMVTDAEKRKRRQAVKEKRRRCGRKRRPLPRARPGADGKYKEFKIVALYDEQQAHRLVMGTKDNCRGAGRMMRGLTAAVQFDRANEKIGNVDGASWIRRQMERQNLPLDAIGLDFYHLAENVHKARRVVWGEDDETGKTWVGEVLHMFKHEGYAAAWERLLEWRGKLRGSKRAAADTLINYVSDRRDMIKYPEFQQKGWQIGSGPTEATCKTSTARLKRSGMRWDGLNAEGIMALESLWQSDMWKAWWKSRLPLLLAS